MTFQTKAYIHSILAVNFMLFNSIDFFVFFISFFFVYWFIPTQKGQNICLLISSYFFYGFWDWRFLYLILFSTTTDFFIAQFIFSSKTEFKRKLGLYMSLGANLGVLFFFKYFNFFIDSTIAFFSLIGYTTQSSWNLKIILPVGISFYTFQTLSYTIDVYRKKITPTSNFIAFASFVAFFPQLVAGPIEKASNLLSQIKVKRKFNYAQCVGGLKLILWGLFKKIAIADSLAPIVDDIFLNYEAYSASTLLLGAFFFSFQLYGDFSGYSDMAIGLAKLLGIELMSNFKFPNFSRNVAEHWQRWHISLSNWFKEYVYIPLGGNRVGPLKTIRNIYLIFLISGLWHGANWTFVIWGGLHATYYLPVFLRKKNRKYVNNIIGNKKWGLSLKEGGQILTTFVAVTIARIFFRSTSVTHALNYFKQFVVRFNIESYHHPKGYRMLDYYILIFFFVLYEYGIRKNERNPFAFKSKIIRFMGYLIITLGIILFFDDHQDRSFIYFQF